MNNIQTFQGWLEDNPEFSGKIIPVNSRWGRIITKWDEKRPDGYTLHHQFAICVNRKTGELYFDCSKKKIWAKNLAQIVGRPLFTIIKTIYHASMIGVLAALYSGCKNEANLEIKQRIWTVMKNIGKELADIIRTPIYGVVLTVMAIAAVVFALFYPNSLYDMRNWIGKVEQSLNWGNKHVTGTLAPCFQSRSSILGDTDGISCKKAYDNRLEDKNRLTLEIENLEKILIATSHDPIVYDRLLEKEKELYNQKLSYAEGMAISYNYDWYGKTEYSNEMKEKMNGKLKELYEARKANASADDIQALRDEADRFQKLAYIDIRLTNYVMRNVWDRRHVYWNPFYQIGRLPPEKTYISSVIPLSQGEPTSTYEAPLEPAKSE